MAPPAQKGRFKPRKPGKKVSAPVGASGCPPPDAVPSAARAPGRGGRGRGRSSGRGRGRGRAPLPRGQVFFTGDVKNAPAKDGKVRGHKRSADGRNEEEIVATLEGGVGSTERKSDGVGSNNFGGTSNFSTPYAEEEPNLGRGQVYYESDSSAEETKVGRNKPTGERNLHPQTTPITLPYKADRQEMKAFFTETSRSEDDWFLMQLPTRLPKVASNEAPKGDGLEKDENPEETMSTATNNFQPAMVSTKPTLDTAFDNSLTKANPGRFGKIRMYASGRAELVLSNGVKLDFTEGLTCSFEQHAVSIDLNSGAFVPLGKVGMTTVATPNVNDMAAWEQATGKNDEAKR